MCGRYTLFTDEEPAEIVCSIAEAQTRVDSGQIATGEICPTDIVPVLIPGPGQTLESHPMRWGYPRWGKNTPFGASAKNLGVVINARGETAAQKPMWRDSILNRRAVVPTTGFIEWRRQNKNDNTRYLFNAPQQRVLYLAAIYQTIEGENRFSIVTTDANPYIADIHDRMPVVLQNEELAQWLFGDWQSLILRDHLKLDKAKLENGAQPEQLSLY